MSVLVKVHKNKVIARLKRGLEFKGWITGSKVHPSQIKSGWHLGQEVTIRNVKDLRRIENEFSNYNSELGFPVFYHEESILRLGKEMRIINMEE